MKILPVTNQYSQNSFKSAYVARFFLKNPELTTKEIISDTRFYQDLAKLDYSNNTTRMQLFNLFKYLTNVLKMSDADLRADVAIYEGIVNDNVNYLKILMEGRELIPMRPDGEVSVPVIVTGKEHSNPQIRSFFEDSYLKRRVRNREYLRLEETPKPYEIIEAYDIFCEVMGKKKPEPVIETNRDELLQNIKSRIDLDEEKFGGVQIETLDRIASLPDFRKIKNESFNISGSKFLHLLAEIPVKSSDLKMVNSIVKKCFSVDYNFNIENDFGETALDKAVEAENYLIEEILKKITR